MPLAISRTSLVTQLVKNLSAMQETWVRSLVWENSLEKGRATHSSILAWRIPPMDCCLPGSSLHGILQARILEWVAISFSREYSNSGIEPGFPTLQADALTSESSGKPGLQSVG